MIKRRRTPNDGRGTFIDGDYLYVPQMFMDAESDDHRRGEALARAAVVRDGTGRPAGSRPGFAYSDDAAPRNRNAPGTTAMTLPCCGAPGRCRE